jgi:hypothetical protein
VLAPSLRPSSWPGAGHHPTADGDQLVPEGSSSSPSDKHEVMQCRLGNSKSIYGGTSEIMKTIIAREVTGLRT